MVAVIYSSSLLIGAVSSMREWKDETQEETDITCSGRLNLKKIHESPGPKLQRQSTVLGWVRW